MSAPGRRATIVAFHGPEPGPLDGLLAALQRALGTICGPAFRARPPATVHATLIGLEVQIGAPGPQQVRDVAGYLDSALRAEPLCLRFGGFPETARHDGFDDEGTLFERTLFVQNGNVVLMGWPVDPSDRDRPTMRLATLRKGCERHGFVHKYHDPARPELLDPDAYLVIGRVPPHDRIPREALREIVRSGPLGHPTLIRVTPRHVRLVEFEDSALPLATSVATPLSAAG